MLTQIQEWYTPSSISEAVELLKRSDIKPYGGGTTLLRGSGRKLRGLIDLRRLALDSIETDAKMVMIGAKATFNQVIQQNWSDGRQILGTALSQAASPSLRNLITIGGSLVARPSWSNLIGPLLLLEAQVEVAGEESGSYVIAEILRRRMLRGKSLVLKVVLPPSPGNSCYFRFSRTAFDYSVAELSAYWEIAADRVQKLRLVVGNLVAVAQRLPNTEAQLIGRALPDLTEEQVTLKDHLRLIANPNFSDDFRLNLINRWLQQLVGKMKEQTNAG